MDKQAREEIKIILKELVKKRTTVNMAALEIEDRFNGFRRRTRKFSEDRRAIEAKLIAKQPRKHEP